ncbi:MAG: hypothetical protein F4X58_11195 [Chloroflexi bacterium]|nr:hypothetical protein [Chloroflexota bacterium]MYC02475.1 hypothetical protein [Chloroflexota bacterium]
MTTADDSRPATISELRMVRDQFNGRIDNLRDELNNRIDDLRDEMNRRIDDPQRMMLWGMGLLAALMIALMGVVLSGV